MWCLTGRDGIGCFLELDDLLIHETGAVVDNLHGIRRVADRSRAFCRLGDLATVNVDLNCMIADLASEERVFHVGDDRRSANDKSLDCNDFVDICKS